ncbi:MAG: hypothetical protein ACXV5H_05455, partial [Halobacteriota archaeon]
LKSHVPPVPHVDVVDVPRQGMFAVRPVNARPHYSARALSLGGGQKEKKEEGKEARTLPVLSLNQRESVIR